MAEVSSNDEELISAFEDAVERIESLAMGQPDRKAQSEGAPSEKKDRHTDQIEDSIPDGAQGIDIGANNDSFTSGEADGIKGIFENYIESQYEYVGTEAELDTGSEHSGLAEKSTIALTDRRIAEDLSRAGLAFETPVSDFDTSLSSGDAEDSGDFADGKVLTESENYHGKDDQTDAVLSSDQADSFFDEDVIVIDANSPETLGHEDGGNSPNAPEAQEENVDIEVVDAPEPHFDESVTDKAGDDDIELENVLSSDDEKGAVPDDSVSDYAETSIESQQTSISDGEINTPMFEEPSLSVVTKTNSLYKGNDGDTQRTKHKSAPLSLVIIGFVILLISLTGIGLLNYRLQSQVDKLNTTIVSMEGQTKGLKSSKGVGVDTIGSSTRTNKRIDELVAQVNKLNGALVHLNGREQSAANQNRDKSSPIELSALYGMISSLEQQFQQFKLEQGGLGAAKTQAPVSPKVQEPTANRKRAWSVQLMSVRRKNLADRLLAEFQSKGIPAEQQVVTGGGRSMYRLGVGGFLSKKKATEYGVKAIKILGLDSYWVTR